MAAAQDPTRKAYDAGWRAGQDATPAKVAAADRRRAPAAWYLGFFDAEAGAEKYSGLAELQGRK